MSDLTERISKIEQGLKTFTMIGSGGAQVEGSFETGYCITCPEIVGASTTTGGVIPPPITPSGACCIGNDCTIRTEENCLSEGGTYQGDNTTCSPNPCGTTGACCHDDGSCTETTQAECDGDYQGDGTTCDPNPCPQPPPNEGACCIGADCSVVSEADCVSGGGHYFGDGTTCSGIDCSNSPEFGCSPICCLSPENQAALCLLFYSGINQYQCFDTWSGTCDDCVWWCCVTGCEGCTIQDPECSCSDTGACFSPGCIDDGITIEECANINPFTFAGWICGEECP